MLLCRHGSAVLDANAGADMQVSRGTERSV